MRFQTVLLSALLLLFVFSCGKKTPAPQPVAVAPSAAPLSSNQVGDFKITDTDVEALKAIQKIYDENRIDGEGALRGLKHDLAIAQILKNNGFVFDREALIAEAKYYEELETNRKYIGKIKALFAAGGKFPSELYLRDVILPEYAQRLIYHVYFLRDPKIQKEARQKALDFFEKATKNPGDFEKLAQAAGAKIGIFRATDRLVNSETGNFELPSLSGGKPLDGMAPFIATSETSAEAYRVRALKALMEKGAGVAGGQVVPEIIEEKEGWWIYRMLETRRKPRLTMRLQGAYFPKADYAAWLEKEKTKVNGS